jgi:hypothetical protein
MTEFVQVEGQPRGWGVWGTSADDVHAYVRSKISDLGEVRIKPMGVKQGGTTLRRFAVYEKDPS